MILLGGFGLGLKIAPGNFGRNFGDFIYFFFGEIVLNIMLNRCLQVSLDDGKQQIGWKTCQLALLLTQLDPLMTIFPVIFDGFMNTLTNLVALP